MKFEWKDEFSVGIKQIDEQHKTLISISNKFHNFLLDGKGASVIADVVKFLDMYVKIHFKTEETFMEQFGYPHTDEHKKEHAELVSFVDKLKTIVINGDVGQDDAIKLNIKLFQWYINHIGTSDKKLG
ncbi:MAG: bacteriohemerythrin, partial [Calditerrivibrio sp.]|nr:bacteriohemerythrin [Calditerrivibrio sp.]